MILAFNRLPSNLRRFGGFPFSRTYTEFGDRLAGAWNIQRPGKLQLRPRSGICFKRDGRIHAGM